MKKIKIIFLIAINVITLSCIAQPSNGLSDLYIRHFSNEPISILLGQDFYAEPKTQFYRSDIPAGEYQLQVFLHEDVLDASGNPENIRTVVYNGDITINGDATIEAMVDENQQLIIESNEPTETLTTAPTESNEAMPRRKFQGFLEELGNEISDENRENIAKYTIDRNYFRTNQVKLILDLFPHEESKLYMAKYAHSRVLDPDNYSVIVDLFTVEEHKHDLRFFLYGIQPPTTTTSSNNQTSNTISTTSNNAISEQELQQFLADLKAETFDDEKQSMAENKLNSSQLTTNQVKAILEEFRFEGTKLKIAKYAYPKVTDPDNYSTIVDEFTFNSNKDELRLLIRNSSPSRNNTANNGAISERDFQQFLKDLKKEKFDSRQQKMTKSKLDSHYFTTNQINTILEEFSFEGTKLELAKHAHSRVLDPENYSIIVDSFTFGANKKELRLFINGQ